MKNKIQHKIIVLSLLLTSIGSVQAQYSSGKSHTVRRDARTSGLSDASALSSASVQDVSTYIEYYDRLGRLIQSISLQQSPEEKDMVSINAYNAQGIQTRKYLPFTSTQNTGMYISTPLTTQQDFYNPVGAVNYSTSTHPWADVLLESSPAGRLVEQGDVGLLFQLGGFTTSYDYALNSATDEVLKWELTSIGGLKLAEASFYGAGDLDVFIVKPQNWDILDGDIGTSKTFTNYLGQKILTRSYNLVGGQTEIYDTYYVYDEYGNLSYVIPPEGIREVLNGNADQINDNRIFTFSQSFPVSKPRDEAHYYMPGVTVTLDPGLEFLPGFSLEPYPIDESFLENWVYVNTFDAKNQLIAKKTPGAEEMHYVYDKSGRLIMAQDGNQRQINQWTFTKYDRFDRPILTGNVIDSRDRDALTAYVATEITASSPKWFEEYGSAVHGYTNRVFPYVSDENDYLVVSYYNDYDFKASWGSDYDFKTNPVNNDPYQAEALGLETGGKTKLIGSNTWLKSVNYYDDDGYLIQHVSDHHMGNVKRNFTAYDFLGNILENRLEFLVNSSKTVSINERFEYDHIGRVMKQWHSMDDEPEVLLAEHAYNELGDKIETNLHKAEGETSFMQSIDVQFDVQGRMTHFNSADRGTSGTNANDTHTDQFGMQMFYDDSPANFSFDPQNNGLLAGVTWSHAAMTGADQRGYRFDYDRASRLTSATYKEKNGSAWNTREGHYDVSINEYDYNGNIEELLRKHSISGTATTIDDLVYTYEGNQLKAVDDRVNHDKGFKDGAELATEYTYDANGNLLTDSNKLITSITYNQLNLPEEIIFSSGDKYVFTYDGAGVRIKQEIIISGSVAQTFDYSSGFLFDNGELAEVSHVAGRVKVDVVGNDYSYDYQYFFNDHQGNVRAMVAPTERKYVATMESDRELQEEAQFLYVDETRFSGQARPGGTKSSMLNAFDGKPLGPAKAIRVYAGDLVEMSVYAKHASTSGVNETSGNDVLLNALSTTFGVGSGSTGEALQIYNGLNAAMIATGSTAIIDQNPGDVPKAFLNYIFFDKDYNYESFGVDQVESTGYTKLEIAGGFTAPEDGYVFVYLSNESSLNADVYFDDLEIVHTSADAVLQTDDYYPFGLPMDNNNFTEAGIQPNRFLYQGKEWQTELGLNLYDFHARQYDPALGRFIAPDAANQFASPYTGMGNLPVMGMDPDGNLFFLFPSISFNGGFSISLTAGFGIFGIADISGTLGYNFESGNAFASIGANAGMFSASIGSGGFNAGFGVGFNQSGFSFKPVGISYNARNGFSIDRPSISYGHRFEFDKKVEGTPYKFDPPDVEFVLPEIDPLRSLEPPQLQSVPLNTELPTVEVTPEPAADKPEYKYKKHKKVDLAQDNVTAVLKQVLKGFKIGERYSEGDLDVQHYKDYPNGFNIQDLFDLDGLERSIANGTAPGWRVDNRHGRRFYYKYVSKNGKDWVNVYLHGYSQRIGSVDFPVGGTIELADNGPAGVLRTIGRITYSHTLHKNWLEARKYVWNIRKK